MRQSHKILLIITLSILSFFCIVSNISAADLESPRFKIESSSIDFTAPENNTSSTKQQTIEADQFESNGLIIKRDGQNKDSMPFRFMLEKSLLNMGNVSPNTPAKVSSTVSVAGGRTVYQVLLSEVDGLHKLSGETIADTSCDSDKKCTQFIAGVWNSISSYGLGYSLSGQDIPDDFMNTDYFRPFSSEKKSPQPTIIMTGNDKTDERHSNIIVKTVLTPIQADGTYETTLNFIAVPGY
jgi:hypothetical protein